MGKKLLVKFGVMALALSWGGGIALADGANAPADTTTQTSQTVTEITGSGDVSIDVSTVSTQNTDAQQGAETATDTHNTLATSTNNDENITTQSAGYNGLNGNSKPPVEQSGPVATSVVPATSAVNPQRYDGEVANSFYQQNSTVTQLQSSIIRTAIAVAASAPEQPAPSAPIPSGLLGTLRALLNGSVMPIVMAMEDAGATDYFMMAAAFIATVPSALLVLLLVVLMVSFAAQLRRTGYQGAARSDVGNSSFSLSLHQNWAVSGAIVP